MKKFIRTSLFCAVALVTLYGCGGGGGGGGGGGVTKAVTKVYLYGNMTSVNAKAYSFSNISSKLRIASISSSIDLPSAVMVNYSSPQADITGCTLRKGVFTPSGPKLVRESDFSESRFNPDVSSRKLTVKMFNWGSVLLKASTTGNGGLGEEIATINFTLATPGVKPPASFDQQQNVSSDVGVTDNAGTTAYMNGPKVTFVTTYQ